MNDFFRKLFKQEQGNILVIVAVGLVALLMITGVVIDGGNLYMTKSHLQKTANAAVLSGAQEIIEENDVAKGIVYDILDAHGERESLDELHVKPARDIEVVLTKDVPLFFASLFGQDSISITVKAKAGIVPMNQGIGAVPLGINEDELDTLVYGDPYTLKVGPGDSEGGNFGVLELKGPGANNYEHALKFGFDKNLKVGDIIETETGNMAGGTRRGVDYRIDNCPDPELRDCTRYMLIIVYKENEWQNKNKLKNVEITGFAYFLLSERKAHNDDEINGTFVKRTGTGSTGDENATDRGAYAVRLLK